MKAEIHFIIKIKRCLDAHQDLDKYSGSFGGVGFVLEMEKKKERERERVK